MHFRWKSVDARRHTLTECLHSVALWINISKYYRLRTQGVNFFYQLSISISISPDILSIILSHKVYSKLKHKFIHNPCVVVTTDNRQSQRQSGGMLNAGGMLACVWNYADHQQRGTHRGRPSQPLLQHSIMHVARKSQLVS